MNNQDNFLEALRILDENGLLEYVLLIGSWAEFLYEKGHVIADFISTTKTTDIDFLVRNIRRPNFKVEVNRIFESQGFITDFKNNGVTVFRKKDFEVEFLAQQIGKPSTTIESPNFGTLETLKHMSVMNSNTVVVHYENMKIWIPNPVAFLLHKMIINKDRGRKKEKDLEAIKNLMFYIEGDEKHLSALRMIYADEVTEKERHLIAKFCNVNNVDLDRFIQ